MDGVAAGGSLSSRALVSLLPIVLAAPFLCAAGRVHAQDTVATDKAALVALYDATDGASWTTSTNWNSEQPLSSWHGVTTDSDGRVTRLTLNDNGLDGTLPAALGDLSALEHLDLRDNELSGALPSELVDLTSLTDLYLGQNWALTGALPAGLRELDDLAQVRIRDTELCAPGTWLTPTVFHGLYCPPAAESVIDVAIFYTPAALKSWSTRELFEDEIQLWVADTNAAYRASGVNQRINLVALQETAYTQADQFTDLHRLEVRDDGYMDEVHAIRDNVAADAVVLVRHGVGGGVANLMTRVATSFARRAFSVVDNRSGGLVLAHELGHNMGLHHDRYSVCNGGSCQPAAFQYGYGYVNQQGLSTEATNDDRWRTIMAYDDQCTDKGHDCSRVGRFSNPEQTLRGDSLGVAGLAPSGSADGPSDAVRALNRTRDYVARFRQAPGITVSFRAASYTATEDGTAATVTVRLSEAPTRPIDIPLAVTPGSATAFDYTGVPDLLRFGAYETEGTVTVAAVDDAADENDESFTLAFGSPLPRGVTPGSRRQVVVTLADDDTVTAAPSILAMDLTSHPGADGRYAIGDEIEVSVRFDKAVTVTGAPRLGLTVGGATGQAAWRDTAGDVVRFVYPVAEGDGDDDGVGIAANSLGLNGGTIRDGASQDAVLAHSAVDGAGHAVDGVAPALQSATVTSRGDLALTYGETLDETARPPRSAFTGPGWLGGWAPDVSGRQVTLYAARRIPCDARVSYTPGSPPIRDPAGNAAAAFDVKVPLNCPPETVGSLPALSLQVEDGAETVELSGAFRDRDNDPLTYGASSSSDSVATVSLSGSTLSVTPVSRGSATVTVTATDVSGSNQAATQRFAATVENRSPEPVGSLPALTLRVGGVRSVNVAGAFEDPDGDPLTFEATSSDTLVATVSARGSTVRVSAIWSGTAAVTVTAEDPGGLQAEQVFELTVPNRPPVPVGRLPGLSLASGDGPASVDVSGAFADPDDDPLTFEASSSADAVAAAAAFGSVVEVTPLSAGTAEVTVTATDWGGSNGSATQRFGVGVDRSPPPPPNLGGGPGGGRPPRPPNRPAEAVGELDDRALTVGADPVQVDVAAAFRDPDRDALEYAAESSAEDVAAAAVDGSVVTVTPVGAGTAVVTVTASDGEEGNAPAEQAFTVTVVVDYDSDADGLIEVRTPAQLDAVRHDLDGDGVPSEAGAEAHAAAFAGAVGGVSCAGAGGCRGYELLADLDFDTNGSGRPDAGDAYWRDGSGWLPVGTEAAPFAAIFEGNGRVVRGLFVAGGEDAGLFGTTGSSSVVARVGVIGANVTGTRAVGALAGVNGGRVTASWATGRVSGSEAVGGLVGSNAGDIGGSYAAVAVSGGRQAGGLAGVNDGGLRAVYATGRVSGTAAVGGLVGRHRGTLTASYATGRVRGTDDAGGLVGALSGSGTVTASYWDTETSGTVSSAAGRGLTTAALQRPTAYGGLYAAWNVDADGDGAVDGPWHLGTAVQYPGAGAGHGRRRAGELAGAGPPAPCRARADGGAGGEPGRGEPGRGRADVDGGGCERVDAAAAGHLHGDPGGGRGSGDGRRGGP